MKTVDVLIAAKKLIATEAKYDDNYYQFARGGRIIGSIYKNKRGNDILKLSDAVCFCSLGAINAAVGADAESTTCGLFTESPTDSAWVEFAKRQGVKSPTDEQRKAFWKARRYLEGAIYQLYGSQDIAGLNDGPGNRGRVMAAFDLAIKNAKRRHINGARYAELVSY